MLLNRQRVKFWQKIVFGFMAVLMAGFLIFGYSGVASSCSRSSAINSGSSAIDKQVKTAVATLAKNPNDPTALLGRGPGLPGRRLRAERPADAPRRANDLTKALSYYDRYLALPDSALGAAAAGLRFKALQTEAQIYSELIDYKSAVAAYKKMLKLRAAQLPTSTWRSAPTPSRPATRPPRSRPTRRSSSSTRTRSTRPRSRPQLAQLQALGLAVALPSATP